MCICIDGMGDPRWGETGGQIREAGSELRCRSDAVRRGFGTLWVRCGGPWYA